MTGGGPDGLKRKDFPGGWADDPINAFTAEGRKLLEEETGFPVVEAHDFLTRVANWRQSKDVIHSGELTHFIPENNVYVYFRHNEDETIMVVLNAQDEPQRVNLSRFYELMGDYNSGFDVIANHTFRIEETLEVAPLQSMIIELGKE